MKRSVRKKTSGVSVTYKNGNFSNNLIGNNFELDLRENIIEFHLSLEPNLRVRNKESNCFFDAKELIEDFTLLKELQIDEEKIYEEVSSKLKSNPDLPWKLTLHFGSDGSYSHETKPEVDKPSVWFSIIHPKGSA